jgi:hypothetical protein
MRVGVPASAPLRQLEQGVAQRGRVMRRHLNRPLIVADGLDQAADRGDHDRQAGAHRDRQRT